MQQIKKDLMPDFVYKKYYNTLYTTEEPHYIIIGKVESVVNNETE